MSETPIDDFFGDVPEPVLRMRHRVDVVLVTHDGARWLPRTLAALRGSTVQPDAVHVLDTGSVDATAELLADAAATLTSVTTAPRDQAYGVSLAQLISALPNVPSSDDPDGYDQAWIWIMHDDSAPASDALQVLLNDAELHVDAAILGCKSVGWNDSSKLQDVGLTLTGAGHRNGRVERGERDQGQYIESEEVLAVGSAGMLMRRDVWQTLQGMRPIFPFYRDDIDFCWRAWEHGYRVRVVPRAEIAHREAATFAVRSQDVVEGTSHRVGREVSLKTAYIHARPLTRPFTLIRLVVASLARALVYFLGKDPRDSGDELAALLAFLRSPFELMREIEARGVIPVRAPRTLRPRAFEQLWHGFDLLATLVVEKVDDLLEAWAGTDAFDVVDVVDSADDADVATSDEAYVPMRSRRQSFLTHVWRRPGTLLFLVLLAVGVFGTRNLWSSGVLQGGGLLPVEGSSRDLLAAYFHDWHRVGMGTNAPAAPWMPVLALWSLLFFGHVSAAVTALLVLGIPLAGLSAHLAARSVLPQAEPRAFLSAAYALLPAILIGISDGRLGVVVLAILLPPLLRLAWRCDASWRRAGGMALMVALAAAWVPVAWLFCVVWAVVAAVLWRRDRSQRLRLGFVAIASWLLLFPASMEWLVRPATMMHGSGADVPGAAVRNFYDVLLLAPGGPSAPMQFSVVGFVLASAAALVQRRRARRIAMGWMIALIMFGSYVVITVLTARIGVRDPATGLPLQRWAGPLTLVLGLVFLVIIAEVVDGLAESLSRVSFSWRHIVSAALSLLVVFAPVVSAGSWLLRNSDATVTRTDSSPIPAFVLARATQGDATRVLVLHRDADGAVRFSVFDGGASVLGDADVARDTGSTALTSIVSSLLSGRDRTDAQTLAAFGIMYVVDSDGEASVSDALDGAVGLRRLSGGAKGTAASWEVQAPNERAALRWVDKGVHTVSSLQYTVGTTLSVSTPLPKSTTERVVSIAEPAGAWRATLGGRELPVAAEASTAWRQAWSIPKNAKGQLVIRYEHGQRFGAVTFQIIMLLMVIVVALPTYRPFADQDPDSVVA